MAFGVVTINETIDRGDSADLLLALKHKNVALRSVTPECAQQYRDELKSAKDKKEDPSMSLKYYFLAHLVLFSSVQFFILKFHYIQCSKLITTTTKVQQQSR